MHCKILKVILIFELLWQTGTVNCVNVLVCSIFVDVFVLVSVNRCSMCLSVLVLV